MPLPAVHKPAEIAAHLGVSERLVRETARAHGACRVVGKTMVLTDDDLAVFMEAIRCPSKSIVAARSGTIEAPLRGDDYGALRERLTAKSRKGSRQRSKTARGNVVSMGPGLA